MPERAHPLQAPPGSIGGYTRSASGDGDVPIRPQNVVWSPLDGFVSTTLNPVSTGRRPTRRCTSSGGGQHTRDGLFFSRTVEQEHPPRTPRPPGWSRSRGDGLPEVSADTLTRRLRWPGLRPVPSLALRPDGRWPAAPPRTPHRRTNDSSIGYHGILHFSERTAEDGGADRNTSGAPSSCISPSARMYT